MIVDYVNIAIAALSYAAYTLMIKGANEDATASALILAISAILPIAVKAYMYGAPMPATVCKFSMLSLAGLLMGIGFCAITELSLSKTIDIGVAMATVDALMILLIAYGGVRFFEEYLLLHQKIFIFIIAVSIVGVQPGFKNYFT